MKVVLLSLMLLLAFIAIDCSPEEEEKMVGGASRVGYTVIVETGSKKNAGTSAKVFIQLFGSKGVSPEIHLDTKGRNDFERGKIDTFHISTTDVGSISKIRIRHDSSGQKPGWFLNKVSVLDGRRSRMYEFRCYQWLAKDHGDGKISRDLPAN